MDFTRLRRNPERSLEYLLLTITMTAAIYGLLALNP